MVRGLHKVFFLPESMSSSPSCFAICSFWFKVCSFVRRSWTNDDVGNFFADTLAAEAPVGAGQRAVGHTCQKCEATSPKAKTKRPSFHRKIGLIASTATSVFGRGRYLGRCISWSSFWFTTGGGCSEITTP